MLIPVKTVTGSGDSVTIGGEVHRQVQRNNTVALFARCAVENIVIRHCSLFEQGITPSVRQLALADCQKLVLFIFCIHFQCHHHDTVTMMRAFQCCHHSTCASKGFPIPYIGQSILTHSLGVRHIVTRMYCQVQRHNTVAACRIGKRMRQVIAGLCNTSVFVPIEAVACNSDGITIVGVIHRQVQGHDTVATCRIGERVFQILAGLRNASMFVPVKAVTSNSNGVSIVSVIHRQVQGHDAVAACRIGERVFQIFAGLRNASMFVPVEAVAGDGNGVTIVGVVHYQVQCYDAVAACRIGERVGQVIA